MNTHIICYEESPQNRDVATQAETEVLIPFLEILPLW
jgi:hypothetical protein